MDKLFIQACSDNNLDVVKYCLQKGADMYTKNDDNDSAMYIAIENGNLEMVQHFIENKFDVNTRADNNSTPLHWAVDENDLEMVKFLIEKGADPTLVSESGNTALHWASMDNNLEIVKYLVEVNDSVLKFYNEENKTPIDLAKKHSEVEEYLTNLSKYRLKDWCNKYNYSFIFEEENPDVNKQNYYKCTALHCAVTHGDKDIVEYLISKGADALIKNYKGHTPLDTALHRKNLEVIDILVKSLEKRQLNIDLDCIKKWCEENGYIVSQKI